MGFDLSRLPTGERAWTDFLGSLRDVDDRAERYFLELKSDVYLTTKVGWAKVAKFILGAANRPSDLASRRFEGRALMVLGVNRGVITGVPGFEAKDLTSAVQRFLGTDGPGWDFERIAVGQGLDVVVIVVDPPTGTMWTCRADGPETLTDGGIYIRADGETRRATGDEIRQMTHRMVQASVPASPKVDVDVTINGSVWPVMGDESVLEKYLEEEESRLLAIYDRQQPRPGAFDDRINHAFAAAMLTNVPDSRSREDYAAEISDWLERAREAFPPLLTRMAAAIAETARIRVVNNSDNFLEDVELRVHLEGPVEATEAEGLPRDLSSLLPRPPREWGPTSRIPTFDTSMFGDLGSLTPTALSRPDVTWRNGGSVTLSLQRRHLRPRQTWVSDDEEFCLVTHDADLSEVRGTWTMTAKGHHTVYEGELTMPVADALDCSKALARKLRRGD